MVNVEWASQVTLQGRTFRECSEQTVSSCGLLQGLLHWQNHLVGDPAFLMATHISDWVKKRHQDLAILAQSVDTDRQVSLQSSLLGAGKGGAQIFVHAQPLDFFLCPILLLPPSFHRSWSLINTLHPDSHSGSASGNLTQGSFSFYLIIFHLTCLSFPLPLKQWRDGNRQQINI